MGEEKIKTVVDAFLQICIDNGLTYTEMDDVVFVIRRIVAEQRTALANTSSFSIRDV